jgi:hypothetical protein
VDAAIVAVAVVVDDIGGGVAVDGGAVVGVGWVCMCIWVCPLKVFSIVAVVVDNVRAVVSGRCVCLCVCGAAAAAVAAAVAVAVVETVPWR